ncbi:MAG: YdcF family protein [Candidatus Limnocylindrales bacterium]
MSALVVVVALGYTTFRIWQEGRRDDRRPADAIVVLGAAQYDGRPSRLFGARLDHAIALFRAGRAPRLIVTGGKAVGDRTTEAGAARGYLNDHGIGDRDILSEDISRTTQESIRAVAAMMDAHGLRSALFVSDRPHMLRVLRMAADSAIDARGSPTASSPLEGDPAAWLDAVIHEVGGLTSYFVLGRGR